MRPKEELIKSCWKSSTLRNSVLFYNLPHISGKTDRIFMKILPEMYRWTRKSPLNFGRHLDIWTLDAKSGSGPDLPWRRSTLTECSRLLVIAALLLL